MPWENLNVQKVRKMYSAKDETNPYAVYGTSVPITIPGSKGYLSSRLLDLLAMSKVRLGYCFTRINDYGYITAPL